MSSPALELANAAYDAHSWDEAAQHYRDADAERDADPLSAADLERWGLAAYLSGRDEDSDTARERAHHAYVAAGQYEDAARVGQWLGIALAVRGEPARGGGWFARVQTVLDEHGLHDSIWQLFLRVSAGMMRLFGGDPEGAADHFTQLLADSESYDDQNLAVLVRNGLGQALVASGRLEEGMRYLDDVMVRVTTDDRVLPQFAGLMYCAGIEACRRSLDVDRAREWTEALDRWCARQQGLVPYRGQCLVHRAEVLVMHGSWPDAHAEIDQVFSQLRPDRSNLAAAMAHYQRGELHRLRGEVDKAEASYREASRCGLDPQPGLALLRLAQGRNADAHAAIRRAVDETWAAHERLRMLPAYVDIAIACGDLDGARTAAAALRSQSDERGIPMVTAAAAYDEGRLALADGQPAEALRGLREALSIWQRMAAPYEAANARVEIALACRALGDADTADLELDAARWAFDQLGAAPDVARTDKLTTTAKRRPAPGGLTPREAQVLRMVATGATNRAIAKELYLSEQTVARHVANIFLKLDVSSRAAATAYAYEHHLV
ncbi:MAG TPA: LuxR C-terminal-related transcriptional regulator [Mycobacteriales bacterium]|nr:LuxR C-terminal-related transcriptional regulator [Mycobacteriales bacterium]